MSILVHIKNFQSIKEVEVLIDGFTVVTGPNNSGKTAIMRAIHGVFTNASPGGLIRHGEAFLSVGMKFSDGTTVLWERGWEKPDQKGKLINRYTINGITINSVGKGPPPEVEALGVRQISASTDRVWPQIAEQFDGVLFLVNRPASAIAEALSDVERVGRLSNALKLSEKDRRSSSTELEVRRKDVKQLKSDVRFFDGLELVSENVKRLSGVQKNTQDLGERLEEVKELALRHSRFLSDIQKFSGLDMVLEDVRRLEALNQSAQQLSSDLRQVQDLRRRLLESREAVSKLNHFSNVTLPDPQRAQKLSEVIKLCLNFTRRRAAALEDLKNSPRVLPTLPDHTEAARVGSEYREVYRSLERMDGTRSELKTIQSQEAEITASCDKIRQEVSSLLGTRGICPTCNTVHEGTHG